MTTATTEQSTAAKKSRKRTKVTHKDILQASVATNQELAKIITNTGKMVSTEMRLAKDQKDQANEGRLANRSQTDQQAKHWELKANKPTFIKALLDRSDNKTPQAEQKSVKPASAPRTFKPTLTPLKESKLHQTPLHRPPVVKESSPVTDSAKPLADRWRRILAADPSAPIVTPEQQKHGEAKVAEPLAKAAPAPKAALAPKGPRAKGSLLSIVTDLVKGVSEAGLSFAFPGESSVGGNMDAYHSAITSGSESVKDISTWTVYGLVGGFNKGVF